ncbi:hypothetical protein Stsp02_11670 [Streptomyces sp. NBRC 14336]|uniref:hypothetical protein n=1 Tax=Streptomyces sp. NBRC 14336 TaxID=3030992 RepID=UPI0024A4E430|nr:hypothetical protein [Streptomyces sp. NBRC 14336]GLW45505.1 hypothetical protein Stsp02_11670 [Streptomyces sp. NBRC 14336]
MTYVTIGGVTVGLCILIRHLIDWWPGSKALRGDPLHYAADLGPFLLAWAYGVLATLGVGGLVGWIADTAVWISSWLGDVALVWGVGGQAGTSAGGVSYLPLTQTGSAIVLVLTVALAAAVKKSRYGGDIKRGAWCGATLGTSAGVAGFAAVPLAQAVNWAGAAVFGALA